MRGSNQSFVLTCLGGWSVRREPCHRPDKLPKIVGYFKYPTISSIPHKKGLMLIKMVQYPVNGLISIYIIRQVGCCIYMWVWLYISILSALDSPILGLETCVRYLHDRESVRNMILYIAMRCRQYSPCYFC